MQNTIIKTVLILSFFLSFSSLLQAKSKAKVPKRRSQCRKNQLLLKEHTPLRKGAGFSYAVMSINMQEKCFDVIEKHKTRNFYLIAFSNKSAAWVYQKSKAEADILLKSDQKVIALHSSQVKVMFTAMQSVLMDSPSFFSDAMGSTLLKEGMQVELLGQDQSREWLYVSVANEKGWLPKYQLTAKAIKKGQASSAGIGFSWAKNADKTRSYLPKKNLLKAKQTEESVNTESEESQKNIKESAVQQGFAHQHIVLGRSQEILTEFSYLYWQEDYLSDAKDDPFARYSVAANLGGHLNTAYMYRGDSPFVAGFSLGIGGSGYLVDDLQSGAEVTNYLLFLDAKTQMGWRVLEAKSMDIELGALLSAEAMLNFEGPAKIKATIDEFSYAVGPSARSKMYFADGKNGSLTAQVQLPIGVYHQIPFPSDTYYTASADCNSSLDLEKDLPGVSREDFFENPQCTGKLDAAYPQIHLMVGANFDLEYRYPLSDSFAFETGLHLKARHASIRGGGIRNLGPKGHEGAYSQATNINLAASLSLGFSFFL